MTGDESNGPAVPASSTTTPETLKMELPQAFAWIEERPFFQAGLQGYSDAAMRIIARRHGSPYCVTEAMSDRFLVDGGKGLKDAELDPEDHPIAGQLMGSDPHNMAAGAKVLLELGYDVIDLNMACPVKRLRGCARGGHLLHQPEKASEIIQEVSQAVGGRVPLTIKLRRGFDDEQDSEKNFFRIIEDTIDQGFFAAVVHGRTVRQKYEGPSRWNFLSQLTQRYPDFRIMGSGDIFTPESVFEMLARTGVDAVSVARGAIGNPWIFRQASLLLEGKAPRPPSLEEQGSVLRDHFELCSRFHTERKTQKLMRKFGIKFSIHHPEPGNAEKAFISCRSLSDWWDVFKRLYCDTEVAAGEIPNVDSP